MGARCVLELPSGFVLVALVAFASCWEVRRSWTCCRFLSLLVEIVWRVGEVLQFVCLQCLIMEWQGWDFGGRALIRVRRWWRFLLTICMAFFHSVIKLYCIRDSFMCGAVCIHDVAAIMMRFRADVPTFISAYFPTSSYYRFIVSDDFCAWWR